MHAGIHSAKCAILSALIPTHTVFPIYGPVYTGNAGKPYRLTFEVRPEYLHARIAAPEISRIIALDYLSEIADKCAATRRKKVLLERDIDAMIVGKALFETTKDFVRMNQGIRIALVNPHLSIEEALRNIIDYASSIGGEFEYFNTVADAKRWLLLRIAENWREERASWDD